MSLWNHLRAISVQQFCQKVADEGRALQQLHERFKPVGGVE